MTLVQGVFRLACQFAAFVVYCVLGTLPYLVGGIVLTVVGRIVDGWRWPWWLLGVVGAPLVFGSAILVGVVVFHGTKLAASSFAEEPPSRPEV
jgi:MFS family permease